MLWKLSSTGSTQERLRLGEKWAVVYRDVVAGNSATREKEFVRDVNQKRRYIAPDFDTEHHPTAETGNFKNCERPDENIVTVGAEDVHCTEVFVQPSLLGKVASGHEVRH